MTLHQKATLLARESTCLVCGTTPSEPCHIVHRGLGGAKAGWDIEEWIPLCRVCHNLIDARNGVSAGEQEKTRIARYVVSVRARAWQLSHQEMIE